MDSQFLVLIDFLMDNIYGFGARKVTLDRQMDSETENPGNVARTDKCILFLEALIF